MSSEAQSEQEVIVISDSEDDPSPRAQRAASGRGAGPSGVHAPAIARRRAAGGSQQRRPTAGRPQQQQAQQEDVVDLTGPVPDLGDVQIVSATAGRRLPARRPRVQPLSPAKQALLAAMLNPRPPAPPPEPEPPGPKCGVCMEPMGGSSGRQMASGSCGHVYCRECLVAAVKAQKKCPTCRKNMQMKQIHNVFLNLS